MNIDPNKSATDSSDIDLFDEDDCIEDEIELDWPIRPHHRFIIDLLLSYTFRTPKPVTKVRIFSDRNMYAVCPRCNISMEYEYQLYCNRCGQHLEWSKYDDAEEEFIGWNGTETEDDEDEKDDSDSGY